MTKLADCRHRAIKVDDPGDEIDGLLADWPPRMAAGSAASKKQRRRSKKPRKSPYWGGEVVRLDDWSGQRGREALF